MASRNAKKITNIVAPFVIVISMLLAAGEYFKKMLYFFLIVSGIILIFYFFYLIGKNELKKDNVKNESDINKKTSCTNENVSFIEISNNLELKDNHNERMCLLRDADYQDSPYIYQIGTHGNESLAIRYGIANWKQKNKIYLDKISFGVKSSDEDNSDISFKPSNTITLQKTRVINKDKCQYEVLLTDFGNRKARVVIEVGTEYVKTFYPIDDSWFEKYSDLELTLKSNGTFNLKELATFHVKKTLGL